MGILSTTIRFFSFALSLAFFFLFFFLAFLPSVRNFVRNTMIYPYYFFSSDIFLVEFEVEPGRRCSFLDAK